MPGTMWVTVVSPPANKKLAKTSSCHCSSSFQGGGQQHSLLQPLSSQESYEKASLLALSAPK